MSPRDVYRAALRADACVGVVVCHNHPSGDPSPSPADIAITKRLIQAGTSVDVPLCDHVILTPHYGISVSIRRERPDLWG
jgi:DNA repair protein RadC